MSQSLKNGFAALAKKIAAIVGGSVAAFSATEANAAVVPTALPVADASHYIMVAAKSNFKRKPMMLLKLNPANPSASKLIASHGSHGSHSSHSSHSSHRSRL